MNNEKQPVILTIDDERHIRESFRYFLEDCEYNVLTAENGRKGLDLFQQHSPDLVLLDLRMPEIDGLEVLARIKKQSPDTPVLVVSGTGVMADAVEALRLGAWDFLLKPIEDLSVLHHTVKKNLERIRLIRENRAYQHHLEEKIAQRTRELQYANAELQQINLRLHRLVESTKKITTLTALNRFGSRLLEEFGSHMLASGGSLYLVEPRGLQLVHALDPGHAPAFIPYPLREGSIMAQALTEGKALLIRNADASHEIISSGWNGYKDNSVLVFPLPDEQGTITGILSLHSKTPPPFIEQDREIGAILASYSCEALKAAKAGEALRQSEENLSITLDSISDAVIATDSDADIKRMNPAAEKLTGWHLEEAVGNPLSRIYNVSDPHTGNPKESPFQTIMNNDAAITSGSPNILTARDGTQRRIAESASPIHGKNGTFVGMVLVFRDVTEQFKLEEQLRHSRKMDAIGQLAGGIAHDFNNMLGGILGAADILHVKLRDNEKLEKYVSIIQDAGKSAAEITRKLLDFSRKRKPTFANIDMHKLTAEATRILERSTDRRIAIQKHFNAQMSTVFGNASQVQNAVLNLGINAGDAMPEGGTMTISTENVTLPPLYCGRSALPIEPGPYIEIRIADTGIGMNKEVQERIFEPFFTTKGPGRGTGLGLPSVYKMIRDHGGDIQVQSRLGAGTAFKLRFPVTGDPAAVEPRDTGQEVIYGSGHILVVDDESVIRSTIDALLKEMGYEVSLAEDGEAAVEIYGKNHQNIDMVLLDQVMPKLNGRDTFYALRKINPRVKILLTSGFPLDAAKNELLKQGAMGFIPKPFNRAVLSKHIHRILNTPVTPPKDEGGK